MGLRLDQFRLSENAEFRGVVKASVVSAMGDVLAEAPETPNHERRVSLANSLALEFAGADSTHWVTRFVWAAAMNPTIRATAVVNGVVNPELVQDADVDFVVASHWDTVAGQESSTVAV